MKLIRLPAGEHAPADTDCISISRVAEGRYVLSGSLLSRETSIAIGGGDTFESFGLAEAAGASWAEREGVCTLYVSTLEERQLEDAANGHVAMSNMPVAPVRERKPLELTRTSAGPPPGSAAHLVSVQ